MPSFPSGLKRGGVECDLTAERGQPARLNGRIIHASDRADLAEANSKRLRRCASAAGELPAWSFGGGQFLRRPPRRGAGRAGREC